MWDDGTDRRNSTREVVRRAYRLTEGDQAVPDEGDLLTRLERICGDFTHALINGEMDEAWYRADGSNTYILSDLYDEWEMDLYLDRKQLPRAFKTERSLHPSWTGGDA